MIYSFWMFDRHCDCIFRRSWHTDKQTNISATRYDDTAKLVYGIVLSLRNMARKLTGDDSFNDYSTSKYRLHYYETPSNLKLVLITDPSVESLHLALRQIYATLYLEYVVKNPLSPVEHTGGAGVENELFVMGLDAFISGLSSYD